MRHIKGIVFGFPILKWQSLIDKSGSHHVGWNRHDGFEVHYMFKGRCSWEFERMSAPVEIHGGTFLIIPPQVLHRAVRGKGEASVRIGIIYSDDNVPLDALPFGVDGLHRIFARFRENSLVRHTASPMLAALLKEMRSLLLPAESLADFDLRMHLMALSTSILFRTYQSLEMETRDQAGGNIIIRQICGWMQEHLSSRFTVDDLVRRSGYGRSHFFSQFLADTGMTPNDYLVRARIACARQLLKSSPGMSMREVALKCGFSSASSLATLYKRHTGVTPSRDRVR
ncbi:MAG: helix-turn-helix transcriptional regulator [Kiritimatiellae bacterium]|nr:helix-turn-helix transcriptional regulator [Kiritimatiellia bacterium]